MGGGFGQRARGRRVSGRGVLGSALGLAVAAASGTLAQTPEGGEAGAQPATPTSVAAVNARAGGAPFGSGALPDAVFLVDSVAVSGVAAPGMRERVDTIVANSRRSAAEERGGAWSLSHVAELLDDITRSYIDEGYINSGATLESVDPAAGRVSIAVVEGRITAIETRYVTPSIFGGREPAPEGPDARGRRPIAGWASQRRPQDRNRDGAIDAQERARIGWRPLQGRRSLLLRRLWPDEEVVLNQAVLQERFERVLADPGIRKIDAALAPGDEPGEARLFLDVYEEPPVTFAVVAASDRTPSVGGERIGFETTVRNLLGRGDLLSVEGGVTEGLTEAAARYTVPVNARGLAFDVFGESSDSEIIEEPLVNLNVLSEYRSFGVGVSQVVMDRAMTAPRDPVGDGAGDAQRDARAGARTLLTVGADIRRKQTESALLGSPFSFSPGAVNGETDNLIVSAYSDLVMQSPTRVFAGRLTYSQGLDSLTTLAPNAPPDDFSTARVQTRFAQRLFGELNHQVIARLDAQYTGDTLYTAERFAFGGMDSVRGYRRNEVVTDRGVVASLEYRVGFAPFMRSTGLRALDPWSLGVFTDAGAGENAVLPDPETTGIVSAGVQLNFALRDRLQGEVYYGRQLSNLDTPADEQFQDSGFGFRITMRGL